MNAWDVKKGLRQFIETNEAALMSGVSHQGMSRTIAQIALSNLTPAQDYYYILIYAARERSNSQGPSNLAKPQRYGYYDIVMEISDEAILQDGETEAYEVMHEDFDKWTDKLMNLLRDQTGFTYGNMKFKLARGSAENDRVIDKENLSGPRFDDTAQRWMALLFTTLRFRVQDCDSEVG